MDTFERILDLTHCGFILHLFQLLGEEEAVGGEKRQRLEEVVVSRSSDTRPTSDAPDCSSVSVFKLPASGVQAVK
jgi:hypothetical protein